MRWSTASTRSATSASASHQGRHQGRGAVRRPAGRPRRGRREPGSQREHPGRRGRGGPAGSGRRHAERQPVHADPRHRRDRVQAEVPDRRRPRHHDRHPRLRRRPRPPGPGADVHRRAQDRRLGHRHQPVRGRHLARHGHPGQRPMFTASSQQWTARPPRCFRAGHREDRPDPADDRPAGLDRQADRCRREALPGAQRHDRRRQEDRGDPEGRHRRARRRQAAGAGAGRQRQGRRARRLRPDADRAGRGADRHRRPRCRRS